jgi:uncharacterized GH25 family protein
VDLFWFGMSLPLIGHVLYGLPCRGPSARSVSFHNGDDFSSADRPPQPARLQRVRAVTAGGSTPLEVRGTVETEVRVDAVTITPPAWIVVETEPVFIELSADSFTRYLEHEGLREVAAARSAAGADAQPGREIYSKHTKTALTGDHGVVTFVQGAVGLPIEIEPLTSTPLAVGGVLDVRVVVDDRPAGGLQLRAHQRDSEASAPRETACLRTNHDGIVSVSIDTPGLWRLHTVAMTPHLNHNEADWRSVWASLTFRI